jgi:SAM-dependent methyltransferase
MPQSERNDGSPAGPNAEQIAYWNGEAGTRWAAQQPRIDALLAEVTRAALEHARPRLDDHVIDVGCGCGATVLELSPMVGPGGAVVGIDISKAMLEVAAERVRAQQLTNVQLLLADASGHAFEPAATDLVFSRFGVMFFDHPAGAFSNIRQWLRPGGRLAFACWRQFSDNPCFLVPFEAAKPFMPPQPRPEPDAPGPFAFADADRVRRILDEAGFSAIELTRHDPMTRLGGPDELESAGEFAARVGPAGRALAEAEPAARAAAHAAILEALRQHVRPNGICLQGSVWLVSARA